MELQQVAATTTSTTLKIHSSGDPSVSGETPVVIGELIDGLLKLQNNIRDGAEASVILRIRNHNLEVTHQSRVVNKSGSLLDQAHDHSED